MVPIRPAAPTARDNLQRISGIDAQTEQRLAAQAVTRYSQIAHWSPADVERFERLLGTSRRIARENWIEQAQILSRGGDTAFSREFDRRAAEAAAQHRPAKLTDAIGEHAAVKASEGPRPELGALRSVRSEAYQGGAEPGPEAARRAASQSKVVRSATLEDLKRIRGIGVLIEKKLNSMGVVSYEQIANWSAEDIDRVSQIARLQGPHRARELGRAGPHPGLGRRHRILAARRPRRDRDQPQPGADRRLHPGDPAAGR